MISHIDTIRDILKHQRSDAAKRLCAETHGAFTSAEIVEIETAILENAPAGARLDKLIAVAHGMIRTLDPEANKLLREKAAYEYPKYSNILYKGFSKAEVVYQGASEWLEVCFHATPRPSAATQVAMLVVRSILDLQILDWHLILPFIESIKHQRVIKWDGMWIGIPIALRPGEQDYVQERTITLSKVAATGLRRLSKTPDLEAYLESLIASASAKPKDILTVIDREIAKSQPSKPLFKISELIRAACQIAIIRMPTSVLAVRSGLTVSHALKLSVLERIGGFSNIPPFMAIKSEVSNENGDREEDTEVEEEDEINEEIPWLVKLRTAVKRSGYDQLILQELAKGEDGSGKWMGSYALNLIKNECRASTLYRYVFLISNRLMPKLGGRDPKGLEPEEWEEQVEQILDEDAFYHRKTYSKEKDENSDAVGYSQQLIKALRSFALFVHAGKSGSSPLASLLPPSGLVRVEANMITVDEFRTALDWFRSPHADPLQIYLNSACRVALILGFRCGLRKAETAYLRACDFDAPLEDEELKTANVHLHVQPWFLRKLKTSNAERDLPLGVLMPIEELEEVMDFVQLARDTGGAEAQLFRPKAKNKKQMKFDRVIDLLEEAFKAEKKKAARVNRFHYHMLRHSAANIWLLKLWPSLHPMAAQILRNHRKTLKWIGESEAFRQALFGNAKICGSDLQAIALLLGHGSAATTVEHYLHVLDWYGWEEGQGVRS